MTPASVVTQTESRPGAEPSAAWLRPFVPLHWLVGGHRQTLAGNYWPRKPLVLEPEAEVVEVDPADGSRVLCHCHWQSQPVRAGRLTLLLVHGLEGSSDSRYIRGITALAWVRGWNVIRMNMRNCGGTESWSPTLYHSGLSADVAAVLRHFAGKYGLQRVAMAGYSMGGNLVLKLAGELGSGAPPWLRAAVAVSPAADLAPSADALHEPANRVYEWHFLRRLARSFQAKVRLFPERYAGAKLGPIRSIRDFDQEITARFSGFTGADDYYARSSAGQFVHQIALPTLVVHADDDPFIRLTPETAARMAANPAITLVGTANGGHCAFLAAGPERHWAEATLIRYLAATVEGADGV